MTPYHVFVTRIAFCLFEREGGNLLLCNPQSTQGHIPRMSCCYSTKATDESWVYCLVLGLVLQRRERQSHNFERMYVADATKEICRAAVKVLAASFLGEERLLTREAFLRALKKHGLGRDAVCQSREMLDRADQLARGNAVERMDTLEQYFPGRCFNTCMDKLLLEFGTAEDQQLFARIS